MIGRKRARQAFVDRLRRLEPALAFAFECEVHHHDAVLLDDADQEDDADEGNQRQLGPEQLQRHQRAESRPRAAWR